jgi:hypothetical protein
MRQTKTKSQKPMKAMDIINAFEGELIEATFRASDRTWSFSNPQQLEVS